MPTSAMLAETMPDTSIGSPRNVIIARCPCSQRVRCATDAAPCAGKLLVTRAPAQYEGGDPAAARSRPSCMSSTMLAVASDAVAIVAHGKAIPVPIN